jgi:hypothetical protein
MCVSSIDAGRVPSPNTDSAATLISSPRPAQAASISAHDLPDDLSARRVILTESVSPRRWLLADATMPLLGALGARSAGGPLAAGLITVGALASITMGSNDVANATGSLVGTGAFSPLTAGLLGGLGLAVGMLTWGRPLLQKVAFDIVTVDRPMATAAQLVQAAVVLAAVAFGFFTSMNQALIGAMTGAAAARGRRTVHAAALYGVLRGWLIGPAAAIALGFGIGWLVSITAGTHALG